MARPDWALYSLTAAVELDDSGPAVLQGLGLPVGRAGQPGAQTPHQDTQAVSPRGELEQPCSARSFYASETSGPGPCTPTGHPLTNLPGSVEPRADKALPCSSAPLAHAEPPDLPSPVTEQAGLLLTSTHRTL